MLQSRACRWINLFIGTCCAFVTLAIPAWSTTSNTISGDQDFGQVQVNGSGSGPILLTYVFPGLNAIPTFSTTYGLDFKLSTPACTGSTDISCSVSISFTPHYPGIKLDAVVARDSQGSLVGVTLLHGIGVAAESAIYPGIITTYAGTGSWSFLGDGQEALSASFASPKGLAIDTVGNVYVADSLNHVVREISVSTGIITTVAGIPLTPGYSGDGGQATQAKLNTPTAITVDGAGNLYIADQGNNRIRKVSGASGIIATVAGGGQVGSGTDGFGDGGLATSAILSGPTDVVVDGSGNLYIADSSHSLIRKVDASSLAITVVAGGGNGNGTDGNGDGGPATDANLNNPTGIAMDTAGNLYIADTGHNLVRFVNTTSGVIDVIAGTGRSGYSGDLGAATNAALSNPSAVRVDAAGDVYIADSGNNVIRQVQSASGTIQTVAGTGVASYYGDSGTAIAANLTNPVGLALDAFGGIYIADSGNNVVRKVAFQIPEMVFTGTNIGQASSPQLLNVQNIGNQALGFSTIAVSSDFQQKLSGQQDCTTSSVVAIGSNCRIAVTFVPTTSGPVTGNVMITTNSLNASLPIQIAQLLGTAVSGSVSTAAVSTSNLAFGNANGVQTVTLSNRGADPYQLAGIWLTGPDMGEFGLTTTCPSVIDAGTSCSASVTFAPTSAGNHSASLVIADWVNGLQTIALTGTASVQPQPSKADFTVWRPSNGTWFLNPVGGGEAVVQQWGLPGDIPVPGDYDGDGKTDFAVWRPSNGTWFVLYSGGTNTYPYPSVEQQWGLPGDIPVPGDYNGDGKTDFAVWRPSNGTWFVLYSGGTNTYPYPSVEKQWGWPSDIPVPGDYDGDGKTDFAVWRPSNGIWFIIPSSNPKNAIVQQWGLPGDIPVPFDYDGDGKTDFAVWRPSNGTWFIIPSTNPKNAIAQQWGLAGDIPVPNDYDGDGKTDFAVWRPSNGTWFIIPSNNPKNAIVEQWGLPRDIPPSQSDFFKWQRVVNPN